MERRRRLFEDVKGKGWTTYAKAFGYGHLKASVYLEFRGSISATLSLESYCVLELFV